MSADLPVLDDEVTKGSRFKNRVVIVTGGASGIGRGTVERFVNDGAKHVSIFDLDANAGSELATHLCGAGCRVTFNAVDVSDKARCIEEVQKVAEQNGGVVHHLVDNAAYFDWKGLNAEHEDWRRTMTVNVEGYANMVQACYPYLKKGKDCTVVNVGSNCAHRAHPNRWTYSASKGAIVSMTKCMALDLGKYGIRVNSVSAGWVWTKATVGSIPPDEVVEVKKQAAGCHLIGRVAHPNEIAAAITFLSSRDASFFTGADVPVDGGHGAMSGERFGFKTL
ncbi:meso-2,3-butanediol dehydrogenase-like [Lineus longissimus]|uniref:meso-2,3-butanediol dehydrogenase-like n=1 Tax=Lineus longissimus TaxID=88925 RepID=UPI00315C7638